MSEQHDEVSGVPEHPESSDPSRPTIHDDDELASALAAQLLRFAPSGPIPIIRPQSPPPPVKPTPPLTPSGAEPIGATAPPLLPTGPRFDTVEPGSAPLHPSTADHDTDTVDSAAATVPDEVAVDDEPITVPVVTHEAAQPVDDVTPSADESPAVADESASEADAPEPSAEAPSERQGEPAPVIDVPDSVPDEPAQVVDGPESVPDEPAGSAFAFSDEDLAQPLPDLPAEPAPSVLPIPAFMASEPQTEPERFGADAESTTAAPDAPTPLAESPEFETPSLESTSVAAGPSAIERAEALQEALSKIAIDDAVYREWEESLRALAPTGESASPASVQPEQSVEVFDNLDQDQPESAPESEAEPEPAPTTSTFTIVPPSASSVPDDELVASAVASDDVGEIVEAELVEVVDDEQVEVDDDTSAPVGMPAGTVEAPVEDLSTADVDDDDEFIDAEIVEVETDEAAGAAEPVEPIVAEPPIDDPEHVESERDLAVDSSDDEALTNHAAEPDAESAADLDTAPITIPRAGLDFDPYVEPAPIAEPDSTIADDSAQYFSDAAEPDGDTSRSVQAESAAPAAAAPLPPFGVPAPLDPMLVDSNEASLDTGSIPIFSGPMQLDVDIEDGIDDVESPVEAMPASISAFQPVTPAEPGQHTGPITPISTASLIGAPPIVPEAAPENAVDSRPAPFVETVGIEPTPTDQRIGGLARVFGYWIAPNASIITVALGAVLVGFGLSARQAIVATVVGVLLSCIPLGLTALASKRTGQPTAVVSRASFGLLGNTLPVLLLLLVRLFWIAMLLWLMAAAVGSLVFEAGYDLFVDPTIAAAIALAVFGAAAAVLAVLGNRLLTLVQPVLAFIAAAIALLAVGLTAPLLDFGTITQTADGDWLLVLGGAITTFSLIGTIWAAVGGDLARYQSPATSGAATAAVTSVAAALPAVLLTAWGVLLAASDDALAVGLQTDPIAAVASSLPGWYPIPVLLAIVVSIVSGVAAIAYSGGLTLLAVGAKIGRPTATALVSVVGIAGGLGVLFLLPSITPVLLDLAPTIAVPIAAWGGIVAGEMLLRRRPFDSHALLHRGGVYADVRWVNVTALIVISAVGLGLIAGTQGWFQFEGYLWRLLGVDTDTGIGSIDLGVLVALVLGLLTPVVAGIPAIRRQESAAAPSSPSR